VRIKVDPAHFDRERNRYALRFCCEDCAHFVEPPQHCAHGWPTQNHRRDTYRRPDVEHVIYCKEFELA